jgi:D-serine deaminase-like pyridoxal phosphate-dependent protein
MPAAGLEMSSMKSQSLSYHETPAIGASQSEIDTPCVIVDLQAAEQNISTLLERFERYPSVSVRPHLKTAKSPHLAQIMLQRGAKGICVAKISEAEVFVQAGITDILITTEIAGALKVARLMQLANRCPELRVVIDNEAAVHAIEDAAEALKHKLKVLIDLNVGQNRTGVNTSEEAVALANTVARLAHLELIGVQGYEGHLQHLEAAEREAKCREAMSKLNGVANALREKGHTIQSVTTGGTGTAEICASCEGITEVQPGSFVFMDTSYSRATERAYQHALSVYATVISKPENNRVVVDAGTKSLSIDMGYAEIAGHLDWTYTPGGDEHGIIKAESGVINLVPGDRIELLPAHIDTTVALHDRYYVMRGAKLEAIWHIATRGKVQ